MKENHCASESRLRRKLINECRAEKVQTALHHRTRFALGNSNLLLDSEAKLGYLQPMEGGGRFTDYVRKLCKNMSSKIRTKYIK